MPTDTIKRERLMSEIPLLQENICREIREQGFTKLAAKDLCNLLGDTLPSAFTQHWDALHTSWAHLHRDAHLKDGGAYRQRRHSCFVQDIDAHSLIQTPHRAHWQPTVFNALHGGYDRMFEAIEPSVAQDTEFLKLISALGETFAHIHTARRWYIEAHQFRINTNGGIGRPTPEGAHRDGVDFVVVMMLGRHNVKGGETRVFNVDDSSGVRFVMQEPYTTILLNDERVIHETTPIQPEQPGLSDCWRDTLVLTYRERGFQSPEAM
jgi:hypothetical protein